MSSYCKGICDLNNESQLVIGYRNGQKYCKKCVKYFKTEDVRYHCCKNILRSKKKHNKTWKNEVYDSEVELAATKTLMENCDEWKHNQIVNQKGSDKGCLLRNKPKQDSTFLNNERV